MLDEESIKKELKSSVGSRNCLKMGLTFLKNEMDITKFSDKMIKDYSDTLVDIWKPNATQQQKLQQKKVRGELVKLLCEIKSNPGKYITKSKKSTVADYTKAESLFKEWDDTVKEASSRIKKGMKIDRANPYVTISIGKNLSAGKDFQVNAKLASSIETKWGGWIEGAFELFNPKLIPIHAGRMDFKMGQIVYDVKSGPAVLNIRDVDGAKAKRRIIQELQTKSFGIFIAITDFQIGIIYGREEIAETWMQDSNGLIIFGTETWRVLTGDEWNAFIFYVWQIRYRIATSKKKWTHTQLTEAVEMFLDSYYGNRNLLQQALANPELKIVEKLVSKS